MNPELDVMAEALEGHQRGGRECECGRELAYGLPAHQAEEIELALRNAGFGVFAFERLGLLEDES